MKLTNSSKVWIAAGLAISAWAGAALASPPGEESVEANLPQAAYRITNWGFDGDRGLWVETGQRHYYGEFLSPCLGALPDRILFKFNPDGSLNRFSEVIVPRRHQACAFKSFRESSLATSVQDQGESR